MHLYLQKLEYPSPKFCVRFGWNCPSGSGEDFFKILSVYFLGISLLSPFWETTWPIIWINLNSLKPEMLCDKFGETGSVGLEKKIFKFRISVILLSSLEKRTWLYIWTNLNSIHQRIIFAKFVEIGQVVLEKKMKMWKVYRQTNGHTRSTDNMRSEKLNRAFSSGLLKHTNALN